MSFEKYIALGNHHHNQCVEPFLHSERFLSSSYLPPLAQIDADVLFITGDYSCICWSFVGMVLYTMYSCVWLLSFSMFLKFIPIFVCTIRPYLFYWWKLVQFMGTVVPRYLGEIGSRTSPSSLDAKILGCSSPLYKMTWYLHRMYAHLLVYPKSSLDYYST